MSKLDIKFKRLTPFKRCVLQNFPFIEEDFDALTNYGLLCKVVEYLNKVITSQNEVQGVTEEIVTAFNNLYDYVKNYFDNLDIQEEIDKKLDKMAEDGTLDAIINNYDKCLFVAPKHIDAAISSFDANLILYRGKSIAIDLGYSSVYSAIINMYNEYNVASLDYVIISHWDTDHIGNLGQMVTNGVINKNTIVYLPAEPSYVNATQVANVKATLEGAGVTYITPTTGNTLEIGLLKMTFMNCDLETLEQYAGMDDARNLMSTIVLIEHKDVKALYTGDADGVAYQNIYEKNQIDSQIDLYKIGHHGFNRYTFQPFIKAISPKYALQTACLSRMADGSTGGGEQITLLNQLGTKIYPCGIQKDYIEFLSDGYEMHVQQGEPLSVSYFTNSKNVYVDISVDRYAMQDGTQEHPYKELSYALACTANYVGDVVTFHIAEGIYGVTESAPTTRIATIYLNNLNFTPVLVGDSEDNSKVRLYGINAFKSTFVASDLTIYCDYRDGLFIRDSDAKLSNVNITTLSGTASTHDAIVTYRSKLSLDECTISYTNRLITTNASTVSMRNCEATNITESELIPSTGDTIFHIKGLNNNVGNYAPSYYNPPVLVFNGTSGSATTTATINGTFSDYQEMVITLNAPGSREINSGVIYTPRNGLKIPVVSSSISSTNGILFTADLVFSNDNTVTVENQVRYQINRSTGNISVAALSSTDINFHDIRGIKTTLLTAPSE